MPPAFDQNLSLLQRVEHFVVQELIAQPRVEAFDVDVRPKIAPMGRIFIQPHPKGCRASCMRSSCQPL
jgi:hypothetical protein